MSNPQKYIVLRLRGELNCRKTFSKFNYNFRHFDFERLTLDNLTLPDLLKRSILENETIHLSEKKQSGFKHFFQQ